MNLRRFLRRIRRKERASSEDFIRYLRQRGAKIGTDVHFYSLSNSQIDTTAPYLLTIGDHVRITEGVTILNHDFSWSVMKGGDLEGISGSILGAQSPVAIGSCVFIGMHAVITRGVTIGDNVIIGAGSVVTRDCPSGGVYAGNPAKYIMSIEEYYRKRLALQFPEAKQIALRYRERFGKDPPREVFDEYFLLFSTGEEARGCEAFRRKMELMDSFGATLRYMDAHPPMFPDYESFLEACWREEAP